MPSAPGSTSGSGSFVWAKLGSAIAPSPATSALLNRSAGLKRVLSLRLV